MAEMISVLAWGACVAVWIRMWPFFAVSPPSMLSERSSRLPLVSIIIPARNEENTIRRVLTSLTQLHYPHVEIIVVDDRSEDNTASIASEFKVKVMTAPLKPEGWAGKNWACHTGSFEAKGDLLLFTDADTVHTPHSLSLAVQSFLQGDAKLLSSLPYHLNEKWWEKLLGPFYCLVYAGASPYDKGNKEHRYAIGQYLLFDSGFYRRLGGHAAVYHEVAEDVALTKMVLEKKEVLKIYKGPFLYQVQMYSSFEKFVKGWIRLLRLGMSNLSLTVIVHSLIPLVALNLFNVMQWNVMSLAPLLITLICFCFVQRRIGNFSLLGVIFFPISVILFISLATLAIVCEVFRVPLSWRGRMYPAKAN